jgi:hypothetical protein
MPDKPSLGTASRKEDAQKASTHPVDTTRPNRQLEVPHTPVKLLRFPLQFPSPAPAPPSDRITDHNSLYEASPIRNRLPAMQGRNNQKSGRPTRSNIFGPPVNPGDFNLAEAIAIINMILVLGSIIVVTVFVALYRLNLL